MEFQRIKKLSLRDPAGSLFDVDGRLIRVVRRDSLEHLHAALESPTFVSFQYSGRLANTRVVTAEETVKLSEALSNQGIDPEEVGRLLEHDRIEFVSYPFEWSPKMLHSAAELTLELARKLLPEGLGLKDATPYNILFDGPRPIFVDILSVEKRQRGNPTWLPFAQYTRTFLNPLLLNRFFNLPLAMVLMPQRNGMDADEIYEMCGRWQRWRQPFFSLITVPHWLNRWARRRGSRPSTQVELLKPEKARFILESLFRHLTRLLREVRPLETRVARWLNSHKEIAYTSQQFLAKEEWVEGVLKELQPKWVLDVGCHTGHFSRLAAKLGSRVVGIDSDPGVIDECWKLSREKNLAVTPLVVNVANPSPAAGWQNLETKSFLQRSSGRFDLVLMLAVVHHLTYEEDLPVTEVLELAAQLTRKFVVIEYIGPDDPSIKDVIAMRQPREVLNEGRFEAKVQFHFDILRRARIGGTDRILYLLKKKASGTNAYAH